MRESHAEHANMFALPFPSVSCLAGGQGKEGQEDEMR